MGPRAQFVCQSSDCRRQAEIVIPAGSEGGQISNPRCTCGWEMKRVYFKPVFRKLSKAEAMMCLRDSGFS
jgi:hypothetical protein